MTNVDTVSTYFAGHSVGGANIVTTGALDSGSITSGFGAIDNGTSNIRSATITAETAFVPDAANGATLGTASLEFADMYLHDGGVVYFGADQDVELAHVADVGLTLKTATTSDDTQATLTLQTGDTDIAVNDVIGQLHFQAPDEGAGTDAILVAAGIAAISEGNFSASNNATSLVFKTGASEAAAEKMRITSAGKVGIDTGTAASLDAILQVGTLGSAGSNRGAVSIKTIANYTTLGEAAIYLEETSGSEGYYMGVASDGGMFFNNSGAAGSTLYLGDDDNVGIGTSAPASIGSNITTLEITGRSSIRTGGIQLSNTDKDIKSYWYGSNSGFSFGTETAHTLTLLTSNVERVKLHADVMVVNEPANNFDFRVESQNASSCLHVDAANSHVLMQKAAANTDSLGFEARADGLHAMTTNGNVIPLYINRHASDGTLIEFRSEGTAEGTIAVSGNTVSYNTFTGTHWSRLADNSKPTILKGTVMESLDAMVNWYQLQFTFDGRTKKIPHKLLEGQSVGDEVTITYADADQQEADYTATIIKEDDIKHVQTKISTTDESKNVYGVFHTWDDKDDLLDGGTDYNDMMIAAVGTYVVRIKSGQTVAKGNLLQSNGDGTAKVLAGSTSITADVLSTVFAKVLSNTKVETYADGSFIVPCAFTNC
jgi:hypothetical protein